MSQKKNLIIQKMIEEYMEDFKIIEDQFNKYIKNSLNNYIHMIKYDITKTFKKCDKKIIIEI